jgi:hypothetical protein
MIYLRVIREPLSLNMKKTCYLGAILCFIPGACVILFHFCAPYVPLWQIPGFYFLVALVNCHVNFWVITCKFLSKAGKTLARNFKVDTYKLTTSLLLRNSSNFSHHSKNKQEKMESSES